MKIPIHKLAFLTGTLDKSKNQALRHQSTFSTGAILDRRNQHLRLEGGFPPC